MPIALMRPLEGLLGFLLDLGIDRERERVAGLRLVLGGEDLGLLAAGVSLDALGAVDAAEIGLVRDSTPALPRRSSGR